MQFGLRELGELLGKDYNYVITNVGRKNLKKIGTGKTAFIDLNDSENLKWLRSRFPDLDERLDVEGVGALSSLSEVDNGENTTKNESTDSDNLQIDKSADAVAKTIAQTKRDYESYRALSVKEDYLKKKLANEIAIGKLIDVEQVVVIIEAYIDQYKRSNKSEMTHFVKTICVEVGVDEIEKADFLSRVASVLDIAADTARTNTMKALLGEKFED